MSFTKFALLLISSLLTVACSRTPEPQRGVTSPNEQQNAPKVMSDQQALTLLEARMKAGKKTDLDCLAFYDETEQPAGTKVDAWEFAAREVHNERCGGDPDTAPVRDRYRVMSTGAILVYDAAQADYVKR